MNELICDKCRKMIPAGKQYMVVLEEGKPRTLCDGCYIDNKKAKIRTVLQQAAEAIINIVGDDLL